MSIKCHLITYVDIFVSTKEKEKEKKKGEPLGYIALATKFKLVCLPVVGSSANITDGLAMSSQARDKRFFSPPLIPRTFASPIRVSAQLTFKETEQIRHRKAIKN